MGVHSTSHVCMFSYQLLQVPFIGFTCVLIRINHFANDWIKFASKSCSIFLFIFHMERGPFSWNKSLWNLRTVAGKIMLVSDIKVLKCIFLKSIWSILKQSIIIQLPSLCMKQSVLLMTGFCTKTMPKNCLPKSGQAFLLKGYFSKVSEKLTSKNLGKPSF